MSEYVKHVSQRKCTKDEKFLDEKFTVLSGPRLLREVMG